MKDMALILQGGGALGAFEYGVVTQLVELGWHPKAVTGVSIGAINAAAIAGARDGDIVASLHAMWQAITLPQAPWLPPSQQANLSMLGNPNFWRSRTDYLNMTQWTSLCDTSPMRATLHQLCDFAQIRDPAHMRFGVTATDLESGAPTTFSNYHAAGAHLHADNHRAVLDQLGPAHVLASGSLPPGFPATEIGQRQYWDGGLFSNTPLDALLNMLEEDEIDSLPIFVVDLFPAAGQVPSNLVEVQTRAMVLQYQNRFWTEYGGSAKLEGFLQMLDLVHALVDKQADTERLRKHAAFGWLMRLRALRNLQVITAATASTDGAHDFSPYGVRQRYQAGRDAVTAHFARSTRAAPALSAVA